MCMACEMEAMWFAAMEARARAVAVEAGSQANLLPLPLAGEGRGGGLRVGEGIAGGKGGADGESIGPLPRDNSRGELRGPPPQGGGGRKGFACEETQGE
jgi:hypothetical protein